MSYNYRITTFIELEHKIKVFLEETKLEPKMNFVFFYRCQWLSNKNNTLIECLLTTPILYKEE